MIENRGSNEGIIGTSTPIEGADYRNGFGPVPGGAQFSFKKLRSVFPQNMYFQEAGATSGTGIVQQTVQIVASHDLTLLVRRVYTEFVLAYAYILGDVVSFIGFTYLVVGIDGNSKLTIWVKAARWYGEEEIR